MRAEDLKVYRDSYALFHVALDIVGALPKVLKYTIGSKTIDRATLMMESIEQANTAYRDNCLRREHIENTRRMLNTVNLFVRLCYERGAVSHNMFADYSKVSTDVGRQLTGWLNSCK